MEIKLNNGIIEAAIDPLGAELIHLVNLKTDYDHMWKGDATYWSGRSPVLFPIIGSLNGGTITIEGNDYAMGNHGFARRSHFSCLEKDNVSAVFRLEANDITKQQYPFDFTLELSYTLIGTAVSISYQVINKSGRTMPFSLGTHPAFNCPMGTTDHLNQWYLEFEKKETLSRIALEDNLLNFDSVSLMMDNSNRMVLTPALFYDGAVVFKEVASGHIVLKSDYTPESLTISYNNLPDLGIWQPKDAPFLCIEPWQGHGDPVGFEGDIMKKPGMVHLKTGEVWEAELRIRIDQS